MDKTDVLIIGGGAVGVCAAFYLREAGYEVTLVDRGEIGSGASHGNMGLVVPSHSVPLAAPGVVSQGLKWMFRPDSPFYIKPRLDPSLVRWLWAFWRASSEGRMRRAIPLIRDLSLRSLTLFDELNGLDGVDFDYHQRGVVAVYRTREGLEEGQEERHLLSSYGLEIDALTPDGLAEALPGLELNALGGLHFRQDAHLTPGKFVRSLADHVERLGVTVRTQAEVKGFTNEKGRITVTHTTRGDIAAGEVVLTAGSWSAALGELAGVQLPIQPAKGYSVTLRRPSGWPETPFMLSESRVAVTPMGDTLRIGGTLELAGMDQTINQRRVAAILNAVPRYLPDFDIGSYEILETWCGLRPCTPDGLPFLGRVPDFSNLAVAAGHAMIGVSLGPVTGKLVRRIIVGERADEQADSDLDVDLDLLAVDRFAD
ncbi:MAG: FAD-dependent oxidoreductase [Gemmatimonadetes bacterium]|nr:FAD-dependent oxidoreductase [Gemmatimonadota bacterium]MYB61615.1 FAD-dependent oxidoreductase [Gemmatimonadota bacterium]